MSDYSEYFLKTARDVLSYETFQLSHPHMTRTYRIVRNAINGITARDEDGNWVPFTYYPMQSTSSGTKESLEFGITFQLGDLGQLIPNEMDQIEAWESYTEKPQLIYRIYRSDKLETPMFGPIYLEVTTFTFNDEGCSLEARAPQLNMNMTGEVYTLTRFPMLRGFL